MAFRKSGKRWSAKGNKRTRNKARRIKRYGVSRGGIRL